MTRGARACDATGQPTPTARSDRGSPAPHSRAAGGQRRRPAARPRGSPSPAGLGCACRGSTDSRRRAVELAVSMWSTPSSIARRRTARAAFTSRGAKHARPGELHGAKPTRSTVLSPRGAVLGMTARAPPRGPHEGSDPETRTTTTCDDQPAGGRTALCASGRAPTHAISSRAASGSVASPYRAMTGLPPSSMRTS
jgi:hypothetical protein